MYEKMGFVETAGSEQTSSVIMLWAKTRVYVCSGRAGGNERRLLFFVRYVEPRHHPIPPHPHPRTCVASTRLASSRNVIIAPSLFLINRHRLLRPPPTPKKSFHLACKFICHSRQPRRNRCVFSCKMRLGFILTVNLHVTPANARRNRCVFQ